jgi:hypothetical protein
MGTPADIATTAWIKYKLHEPDKVQLPVAVTPAFAALGRIPKHACQLPRARPNGLPDTDLLTRNLRNLGPFHQRNRGGQAMTKTADTTNSNLEKDPEDWVSGDEPMTGAQQSYLKTLSEQANAPELFSVQLTKAEASKRIDELRSKLGLPDR